jgi:hypothetical protein
MCRAKDPTKLCDKDDYCDGVSYGCIDTFLGGETICRQKDGDCDVAETCDGSSAECPDDAVADTSVKCGEKDGLCDVDDFCDGTSKDCTDNVAAAGTVCRVQTDLCDVEDTCDGTSKVCTDDVAAAGTVCREAAGLCDEEEICDGSAKTCPDDAFAPPDTVCRVAADTCDLEEKCTGDSPFCPCDKARSSGYTYKCGTIQCLCGPDTDPLELTAQTSGGSGNGKGGTKYDFGECSIGTGSALVHLDYPECLTTPMLPDCPARNTRESLSD